MAGLILLCENYFKLTLIQIVKQEALYSLNRGYGYKCKLNKKVILEKQIAILDKALSFNFENDQLLDMKWTLAEDYFTPEEVMSHKLFKNIF